MGKFDDFKNYLLSKSLYLRTKNRESYFCAVNPNEKFKRKDFKEGQTKTVYRFCTEDELTAIQNENIDNFGHHFKQSRGQLNTHFYDSHDKYLHFFDSKNDAYRAFECFNQKDFLCSFEIDSSILNKYKGYGYYNAEKLSSGYDNGYVCEKIKEYAIPVSEFNPKSLCDSISIEDLFKKQEEITQKESNNSIILNDEESLLQD